MRYLIYCVLLMAICTTQASTQIYPYWEEKIPWSSLSDNERGHDWTPVYEAELAMAYLHEQGELGDSTAAAEFQDLRHRGYYYLSSDCKDEYVAKWHSLHDEDRYDAIRWCVLQDEAGAAEPKMYTSWSFFVHTLKHEQIVTRESLSGILYWEMLGYAAMWRQFQRIHPDSAQAFCRWQYMNSYMPESSYERYYNPPIKPYFEGCCDTR